MQINAQLQARKTAATPRGIGVLCDFFAAQARNAELWDEQGRRYIDFASGIAVLNTGHGHPKVIAAIEQQLHRFTHTAYQVVPYAGYVELAERLNALAPLTGQVKTAFFTTGAEAVENAIKIARVATGRSGVVAFSGAFHGRTLLGMALTGKVSPYKVGFGPFPAEVFHAPYPNALRGLDTAKALAALQGLFQSEIDPQRLAAIIFEPVQGEGGFYAAPPDFVRGLRDICDRHGIVLIADEIQTGFARTGKTFAMQHHTVEADLITVAKSLAAGLPLSGVIGRAALMDAALPGGLGGTYAGNPLAVAAAHAVLDVLEDEQLAERALLLGDLLKTRLMALRATLPFIAEVRGLGSMVAVEFIDPQTGVPAAELTRRVQTMALEQGLILLSCGVHGNVLRFLYPLTIEMSLFEEAWQILGGVIASASAS